MRSRIREYFAGPGAVFAEDCGYEVCLEAGGGAAEYEAVRGSAGIVDWSDWAVIFVRGADAVSAVDLLVTGNISGLGESAVRHTMMLDAAGGMAAELQVYNHFDYLVLTCPRKYREAVLAGLSQSEFTEIAVEDRTDQFVIIGVEGPLAPQAAEALAGPMVLGLPVLRFLTTTVGGHEVALARYGTSGEYGYIFFLPPVAAAEAMDKLAGAVPGVAVCGRAIRELIELEVRSFRLGRDNPRGEGLLAAGLHWMCHFRKERFLGREALFAEKEAGPKVKLIGLRCAEAVAPKADSPVLIDGSPVGYVVNGALSPTLEKGIALAYLSTDLAWVGVPVTIDSTGLHEAVTVTTPFFHTKSMFVR